YMAGRPCTLRPSGRHWPSPASGWATSGVIGAGGGSAVTVGTLALGAAGVVGRVGWAAPPAIWARSTGLTVPPFLGWWWVYQKFSTSLTSHRKWWLRNHSTDRMLKASLPGPVRARA